MRAHRAREQFAKARRRRKGYKRGLLCIFYITRHSALWARHPGSLGRQVTTRDTSLEKHISVWCDRAEYFHFSYFHVSLWWVRSRELRCMKSLPYAFSHVVLICFRAFHFPIFSPCPMPTEAEKSKTEWGRVRMMEARWKRDNQSLTPSATNVSSSSCHREHGIL